MRAFVALLAVSLSALACPQLPDLNPPPEVKALEWMVGTWKGKSEFSFGGMDMEVSTSMACSFEGQFLKTVSTNDYGMVQMTETMYTGWDAEKGEYVSWAFTNISPVPRVERGKMEGGVATFVSEPWGIMGQDMVSRTTVQKLSPDKLKFTLEFKAGDGWEKAADMELTKG